MAKYNVRITGLVGFDKDKQRIQAAIETQIEAEGMNARPKDSAANFKDASGDRMIVRYKVTSIVRDTDVTVEITGIELQRR